MSKQTELTWPRVSTHQLQINVQHRVLPFQQLTNSRLQATAVGLPAPYEPHGNREHRQTNPPAVWSAVRVTTRGHAVQKKSNETKNHLTKKSMIAPFFRVIQQAAAQLQRPCLKIEVAGGRSP